MDLSGINCVPIVRLLWKTSIVNFNALCLYVCVRVCVGVCGEQALASAVAQLEMLTVSVEDWD